MNWTKDHPKEDGFYWYREGKSDPEVVRYELEDDMIFSAGSEIGSGGYWSTPITGEFWPEKLTSPKA